MERADLMCNVNYRVFRRPVCVQPLLLSKDSSVECAVESCEMAHGLDGIWLFRRPLRAFEHFSNDGL